MSCKQWSDLCIFAPTKNKNSNYLKHTIMKNLNAIKISRTIFTVVALAAFFTFATVQTKKAIEHEKLKKEIAANMPTSFSNEA